MSTITRRSMIATSIVGVAGAAMGRAATVARAHEGAGAVSQPACPFHRFTLGSAEITIVSDGRITFPTDVFWPDVPEDERASFLADLYQPTDAVMLEVNALVVDMNGRRVLIDAGNGRGKFQPTAGALPENLEAAGIDPATIDTVVFTHLHPDHLWGVTDAENETLIFPNADYVTAEPELAFWGNPDLPDQMPSDFMRTIAETTLAHIARIRERTRTVKATAEASPGVTFVPTHGHTPGHVAVMIESDGETLLSSGDVITNAMVSLERPDWNFGFDSDVEQGTASRRAFLDQAENDRHPVFAYHLPWPGLGYVARSGEAYRWIPTERLA